MNQLYFMGIFKNQQDFYDYLFKSSNEKDNKKERKVLMKQHLVVYRKTSQIR